MEEGGEEAVALEGCAVRGGYAGEGAEAAIAEEVRRRRCGEDAGLG